MAKFALGFDGEYYHETLNILVVPVPNTGTSILVDNEQWTKGSFEYQVFTNGGVIGCDCQLMVMAVIMDAMQKKERENANLQD